MSEYTSTREGFQRAMQWSLTGPPEEASQYVDGTSTESYYHIMNGKRTEYEDWIKVIAEWRGKASEYKAVVHDFLRDGDQLAARVTGTMKVEGRDMQFESFMFAKIEHDSGRMLSLIERSAWGSVGEASDHSVS